MTQTLSFKGDKYFGWIGTAGSANGDVIYTSRDVADFNTHLIAVFGTDDVDVQVSLEGTIWYIASTVLIDDVFPGGERKVIKIPSGNMGTLHGKFKHVRVLQNGIIGANAFGAHLNM